MKYQLISVILTYNKRILIIGETRDKSNSNALLVGIKINATILKKYMKFLEAKI